MESTQQIESGMPASRTWNTSLIFSGFNASLGPGILSGQYATINRMETTEKKISRMPATHFPNVVISWRGFASIASSGRDVVGVISTMVIGLGCKLCRRPVSHKGENTYLCHYPLCSIARPYKFS